MSDLDIIQDLILISFIPVTYAMTLKLTDEWNPKLEDKSSVEFRAVADAICNEVGISTTVYRVNSLHIK